MPKITNKQLRGTQLNLLTIKRRLSRNQEHEPGDKGEENWFILRDAKNLVERVMDKLDQLKL